MNFPSLVLPQYCNTPISLYYESEEVDKYGRPTYFEWSGFCNYQDSCQTKLIAKGDNDNRVIEIKGKAYIPGDINSSIPDISGGEVEIMGIKRTILSSTKARNLDGSVNFVCLELI